MRMIVIIPDPLAALRGIKNCPLLGLGGGRQYSWRQATGRPASLQMAIAV